MDQRQDIEVLAAPREGPKLTALLDGDADEGPGSPELAALLDSDADGGRGVVVRRGKDLLEAEDPDEDGEVPSPLSVLR
jgi:hypothetical protein